MLLFHKKYYCRQLSALFTLCQSFCSHKDVTLIHRLIETRSYAVVRSRPFFDHLPSPSWVFSRICLPYFPQSILFRRTHSFSSIPISSTVVILCRLRFCKLYLHTNLIIFSYISNGICRVILLMVSITN